MGLVCLWSAPATAQQEPAFPAYTGDQFNRLFTTAPLDDLAPLDPAPSITGSSTTDARIRRIAEERGYLRRPLAGSLVSVDGHRLQEEAAVAWEALQAEADRAGYTLRLLAGYRSIATQRAIFLGGLDDYSDPAIDTRLRRAAPPGYSKHHTGYAVDITQAGWAAGAFDRSPAGRWLAADGYRNAKRLGFVPSYPQDASDQGPDPEAWEWTYVGVDTIRCGAFNLGYPSGLEAANPAGTVYDLEICGGLALTRGALAFYLAETLDLEGSGDRFHDDDGTVYEDAIEAVASAGISSGCDRTGGRFCPRRYATREELAASLTRALDLPPARSDHFIDDQGSPFEEAINRMAEAGITRGCNPPANDRFCPRDRVTRHHLLAFLGRAVDLGEPPPDHTGSFTDDDGSVFEGDIERIRSAGITHGCNPPVHDRFCPDEAVTRAQMAAFLVRGLGLTDRGEVEFTDDQGSPFEADIERLADAGITQGCNPPANTRFCPGDVVTRAQMAAFLARALELEPIPGDGPFPDAAGNVFEEEIAAIAWRGITYGCNPPDNDRFCPHRPVTRGQMAALLARGGLAG